MKGLNIKKGIILCVLVILSLFSINAASAAVWTVCPFDAPVTCDSMTIQGGVDLAAAGDTVRVAEGIYFENVVVNTDEIILEGGWKNDLTVRDHELYVSVIDGSGLTGRVVTANNVSDVTVDGFTIQNGKGGIYARGTMTISNNIISNNTASNYGGGIYVWSGNLTIVNNTITANTDEGIYIYGGSIAIKNTISYANNGEDLVIAGGSVAVSYSNICEADGVTPYSGPGNLCIDPLFVDALNGDYHIQGTSPMIDKANPVGAPADDIDGDARPYGAGFDIGADEYVGEPVPLSTISGFVTAPDHLPLTGVTVKLRKGRKLQGTTTTDLNGYYEFTDVVDGKYVIIGKMPGFNKDRRVGKVIGKKPWAKDEFVNLILAP